MYAIINRQNEVKDGDLLVYVYWFLSYLLGTFLTAYILGKSKGIDLSKRGSGNFGARNAGRVMGKWAFVVTMLGDGLKGAIVVVAGHLLHLSLFQIVIGLFCVVAGHVYPFWHRFKGGKGVATGIGGLLFLEPIMIALLAIGFLGAAIITKSSTTGMLGAFIVVAGYYIIHWSTASIAVIAVLVLIIWANRENVAERVL